MPAPKRRYLTVGETAEYLGLTEAAVRMLRQRERIPFHKVGRRVMFKVDDLDLWMTRHRVVAP
jgi:excisionase family DNA binding protein